MPNIQSKHSMAVAEIHQEFSLNFSLRELNLKREFSNLLRYRGIRVSGLIICFCLNERQGSKQLFENDKTRLKFERERMTSERILREIDREFY